MKRGKISLITSLGNSRFLKTVQCKHPQGPMIVKIFPKSVPINLSDYQQILLVERDKLKGIPNILTYDIVLETERAGYAIRQSLQGSLYDRISTRPFLTMIEKQWITFQLIQAVMECHLKNQFHGDIKTENVLVTSWNWIYLTDFATFKPVHLPDDNPTNFSYFFDASARRSCYVAPERFTSSGDNLFNESAAQLTEAMDIFSLGCTIAEIFLEGTPLFTLSQLLSYRQNSYDPESALSKIENENIRNLVLSMISLDPEKRLTAQEYLRVWRDLAFPDVFYASLHLYVASLSDPHFASNLAHHHVHLSGNSNPQVTDADARIERLYLDFAQLAKMVGIAMTANKSQNTSILPVHINIPEFRGDCTDVVKTGENADIALVFCTLICSVVRNCLFPTSKLCAIDMLLVLGMQIEDEYKLDRIVPHLVALLHDSYAPVRTNSLVALTQLLSVIDTLKPGDANIFPEYILPAVKTFSSDKNDIARASYAQCISTIAETSLYFLELAEILKSETTTLDSEYQFFQVSYDSSFKDLQDTIQEEVVALLTDTNAYVKRALLAEMPRLCIFFGKQKSNDFLISHMITYLNDSNWALRSAFCEAIVGVGTYVGAQSLEQFILPLMVMALTGAVGYIACLTKLLPAIDIKCIIYPMILPFLKNDVYIFSIEGLIENLKPAIRRNLYNLTIDYAANRTSQPSTPTTLSNDNDSDLLNQLKQLGMTTKEKDLLYALKHYISKAAQSIQRVGRNSTVEFEETISLRNLNVIPHTVFLMPITSTQIKQSAHRRLERSIMTNSSGIMIEEFGDGAVTPTSSADDSEIRSRPTSAYLSPGKRLSKTNSIGNFDIASDAGRIGNRDEKSHSRMSSMSAVATKLKTLTIENNSSNSLLTIVVDGQEKHIRSLLEKKRLELSPPILNEFGSKVKRAYNTVTDSADALGGFPKGTLVSHFTEHNGPINDLKMSPDHRFFASCSDDGTVRIWDTHRLHTNVSNRSRLVYKDHGAPVKSIGFIEGRQSLISSSTKGHIHISRVEYLTNNTLTKYVKYKPVKSITLQDDYATQVSHYDTENSSLLVFTTKRGIFSAWDLRSMQQVWSFTPPAHYGEITSMVIAKNHTWAMIGTHRGVLSLWDLRFSLNAQVWQHPSKSSIRQLDLYNLSLQGQQGQSPKSVIMSVENTGGEISVWDVENQKCHQVWFVMNDDQSETQTEIDKLYGNGLKALSPPKASEVMSDFSSLSTYNSPKRLTRRIFAINSQLKFMVSGGNEKLLRFHDLNRPEKSRIFSSLPSTVTAPQYSSHPFQDIYFNIEHTPKKQFYSNSPSRGMSSDGNSAELSPASIPTCHSDSITAIALAKSPHNMVISGARDGIIKVFQ
ncbi:Serine/threonine-protein kinase [Boothiomyces sp. JEL0866]|nr:Serine/threonine-protein kinase [Boothiomyces sp. JEL0866]